MKRLDKTLTLLVVAALAMAAGCSDAPAPDEPLAETQPRMDSLVSAEWLLEHLDDPDLVVLDATVVVESDAAGNLQTVNGRASYEAGHIPGAGFADLMGELSAKDADLQFTLPSPEEFAAALVGLDR